MLNTALHTQAYTTEEDIMESCKWNIGVVKQTAAVTIQGTVNSLMQKLNKDDERDVIPLGHGDPSGFPYFRTTLDAEKGVRDALSNVKFNSYGPLGGLLGARRATAEYLSRDLPYKVSPENVFLTVGCSQAIEIMVTVLSRPGANILLPRPGYAYYHARATYSHLQVRYFDLLPEKGWEIDLDGIENGIADKNSVAIVIINPGNPCGNVFTYQHLNKVAKMASKLGMVVISDEVYAHMVFGKTPFVPMAVFRSIVPVVTLGSISKRWMVPGWRLGWIVINDSNGILDNYGVVQAIRDHMSITANPATFMQGALPHILEKTTDGFFATINSRLEETADIFFDMIKEIHCISCPNKPEASMFAMVKLDISSLASIADDLDFCKKVAEEESVIILPGVTVGMKNWLRISYAVEPPSLQDALTRLKAFCGRYALKPWLSLNEQPAISNVRDW